MSEIAGATSSTCDGCGEELDLLKTHLVVTVKPQKLSFVIPSTPQREDEDEEETDEETEITVGTRSGVGEQLVFHDYEHAASWFEEHKTEVKLTINRDDTDPYAESAEIMHGSDEVEVGGGE